MPQKGEHTWDLIIHYHRCPECGFIIESRSDYIYSSGESIKDLECDRCHHSFQAKKEIPPSFAPLMGDPQPVEMDWK